MVGIEPVMAEDLTSALPRTNPASDQGQTWLQVQSFDRSVKLS